MDKGYKHQAFLSFVHCCCRCLHSQYKKISMKLERMEEKRMEINGKKNENDISKKEGRKERKASLLCQTMCGGILDEPILKSDLSPTILPSLTKASGRTLQTVFTAQTASVPARTGVSSARDSVKSEDN